MNKDIAKLLAPRQVERGAENDLILQEALWRPNIKISKQENKRVQNTRNVSQTVLSSPQVSNLRSFTWTLIREHVSTSCKCTHVL